MSWKHHEVTIAEVGWRMLLLSRKPSHIFFTCLTQFEHSQMTSLFWIIIHFVSLHHGCTVIYILKNQPSVTAYFQLFIHIHGVSPEGPQLGWSCVLLYSWHPISLTGCPRRFDIVHTTRNSHHATVRSLEEWQLLSVWTADSHSNRLNIYISLYLFFFNLFFLEGK